jgi:hypothetical protein
MAASAAVLRGMLPSPWPAIVWLQCTRAVLLVVRNLSHRNKKMAPTGTIFRAASLNSTAVVAVEVAMVVMRQMIGLCTCNRANGEPDGSDRGQNESEFPHLYFLLCHGLLVSVQNNGETIFSRQTYIYEWAVQERARRADQRSVIRRLPT